MEAPKDSCNDQGSKRELVKTKDNSRIFDKGKLAYIWLSHNNSKARKGRTSIPTSLLAARAKASNGLFGDEMVMEIEGSALQNAFMFPSMETDFKAQQ